MRCATLATAWSWPLPRSLAITLGNTSEPGQLPGGRCARAPTRLLSPTGSPPIFSRMERAVVITGCSSGLGLALATRLCKEPGVTVFGRWPRARRCSAGCTAGTCRAACQQAHSAGPDPCARAACGARRTRPRCLASGPCSWTSPTRRRWPPRPPRWRSTCAAGRSGRWSTTQVPRACLLTGPHLHALLLAALVPGRLEEQRVRRLQPGPRPHQPDPPGQPSAPAGGQRHRPGERASSLGCSICCSMAERAA